MRIHPSSVSGTELNRRVVRGRTVRYRPVPIGRISRERLARHIVGLVERPRRALFVSRIYDVPVLVNKLFPELVDWVSATWVRRKQRKELAPPEEVAPVMYPRSLGPWHLVGGLLVVALVARLGRPKLERSKR
jgi:hypothetical protein